MNKDFEEKLKTFKPEFGNEDHIRLLEMVGKLREKENLVNKELKAQRAIKKGLEDIEMMERGILFLMEKNKDHV